MKNNDIYQVIKNGLFTFDSRYIYDRHYHNHLELICIISGQCIISIEDKDIALNIGDCVVISNNVPHKFYVNGINGCKINQLEVSGVEFTSTSISHKLSNGEVINNCINNITTYSNDIAYRNYHKDLINNEISKISILLRCLHNTPRALYVDDNNLANKLIHYIKNNYTDDINYENLSKSNGISSRYLRKLVVHNLGMSAIEYQTYLRIEEAKKLLCFSDMKVMEIATQIGYNTIQYFSEIFRLRIGLTPSNFRKLNHK